MPTNTKHLLSSYDPLKFIIAFLVLVYINEMVVVRDRNGLNLLTNASILLKFWDEAFRTSVYLINRLPTVNLQCLTPVEALFKVPPQYKFLKVFGCSCFLIFKTSIITNFNLDPLSTPSLVITLIIRVTSA